MIYNYIVRITGDGWEIKRQKKKTNKALVCTSKLCVCNLKKTKRLKPLTTSSKDWYNGKYCSIKPITGNSPSLWLLVLCADLTEVLFAD